MQKKALVAHRLQELKDSLTDLQRTALSANENDDALAMAIKREAEGAAKLEKVLLVHRNLQDLHVLCLRHPANVPALITELHTKVIFLFFCCIICIVVFCFQPTLPHANALNLIYIDVNLIYLGRGRRLSHCGNQEASVGAAL